MHGSVGTSQLEGLVVCSSDWTPSGFASVYSASVTMASSTPPYWFFLLPNVSLSAARAVPDLRTEVSQKRHLSAYDYLLCQQAGS